jgi:ankyrin repeat protein
MGEKILEQFTKVVCGINPRTTVRTLASIDEISASNHRADMYFCCDAGMFGMEPDTFITCMRIFRNHLFRLSRSQPVVYLEGDKATCGTGLKLDKQDGCLKVTDYAYLKLKFDSPTEGGARIRLLDHNSFTGIGSPIDKQKMGYQKLLSILTRNDDYEGVRYCLSMRADPNLKDNEGFTQLQKAAVVARTHAMRALIEGGASVNETDPDGSTALHHATKSTLLDSEDTVDYLISMKADVNHKNKLGETPFLTASKYGDLSAMDMLLRRGAHVNDESSNGVTALHNSSAYNFPDVTDYLCDYKEVEINKKDSAGYTPAMSAAEEGNLSVIELLVSKKADVIGKDRELTPLHAAAFCEREESLKVMEYLRGKGANPNARNKHGMTPLHQAAVNGHVKCIRYLIGLNADPSRIDDYKYTPLALFRKCLMSKTALADKAKEVEKLLSTGSSQSKPKKNKKKTKKR